MKTLLSKATGIALSRADVAMLIDALLQAEATLCVVDDRLVTLRFIEKIRAQQLSLADRLEDAMTCAPPAGSASRGDFALHVRSI